MQENARDSLEVFKFNLIEETIGRWLRAVIQHLEEEKIVKEPTTATSK